MLYPVEVMKNKEEFIREELSYKIEPYGTVSDILERGEGDCFSKSEVAREKLKKNNFKFNIGIAYISGDYKYHLIPHCWFSYKGKEYDWTFSKDRNVNIYKIKLYETEELTWEKAVHNVFSKFL